MESGASDMLGRTLHRVLKRMVAFVVVFLVVWLAPMADRVFPFIADGPSPYWLALLHLISLCSMGLVNCTVWMLSRPVQRLLVRSGSDHSASTNGYLPFLSGDINAGSVDSRSDVGRRNSRPFKGAGSEGKSGSWAFASGPQSVKSELELET